MQVNAMQIAVGDKVQEIPVIATEKRYRGTRMCWQNTVTFDDNGDQFTMTYLEEEIITINESADIPYR